MYSCCSGGGGGGQGAKGWPQQEGQRREKPWSEEECGQGKGVAIVVEQGWPRTPSSGDEEGFGGRTQRRLLVCPGHDPASHSSSCEKSGLAGEWNESPPLGFPAEPRC